MNRSEVRLALILQECQVNSEQWTVNVNWRSTKTNSTIKQNAQRENVENCNAKFCNKKLNWWSQNRRCSAVRAYSSCDVVTVQWWVSEWACITAITTTWTPHHLQGRRRLCVTHTVHTVQGWWHTFLCTLTVCTMQGVSKRAGLVYKWCSHKTPPTNI